MSNPMEAPMGAPARSAIASAIRYEAMSAWRHSRSALIGSVVLIFLISVLPAIQVLMVGQLVQASSRSPVMLHDVLWPLVVVTVAAGGSMPLADMVTAVSQKLFASQVAHYSAELAGISAKLTPVQLADSRVSDRVKEARESINDRAWLGRSLVQVLGNVITATSLTAAIWRLLPLAGVLCLLALVPTVVAFARIAKIEMAEWPAVSRQRKYADYFLDQLVYQRPATELASLGTSSRMAGLAAERFRRSGAIMQGIIDKGMRVELLSGLATSLLLGVALVTLVFHGGGAAAASAGIVGVISGLAAIHSTGFAIGLIMQASPKTQSYLTLLASLGNDLVDEQRVVSHVDRVKVRGLTVTYPGAQKPAVCDVSFEAHRGEIIALVGVNGAGKTTAVHALMGLVEATEGVIELDGVDMAGWALSARLAHFGLLTQEFGRYELTVRESLALARPDHIPADEEMWAALESARADQIVRSQPGGLNTQLGPQFGGVGLSGGQWQRLSLARIHLRGAGVWLLDEPTSAIDAESESEIFAELQRTKGDRITIVVSHRAWTLRGMDRIYVFEQGRIVESGTYDELLTRQGRFAAIFAEQS